MAGNYRHLSLEERDTIMRRRDRRMPVGRIAAELRRHPARIYRELRRNFFYDEDAWFRGYFGRVAHRNAASLRVCGGKVNRGRELSGASANVGTAQSCGSRSLQSFANITLISVRPWRASIAERHGVTVSCKTLRQLMIEAGLWKNRDARPPLPHQPRYRRDCRQTDPEGRTTSF